MNRLNIAVMGCAAIAKRSMIPAIVATPECRLVAVASRSITKARAFATAFRCDAIEGYDALLADRRIDAIYIPLPTGMHHEWVIKALESGKHVLAEKSIACNFQSARKMVETARVRQLVLMENYMFQYHKQYRFVKNLLEKREMGEPRVLRASFGFPPLPETDFRYDAQLGGGALLDAAGYTIRAIHLLGGKTFRVTAAQLQVNPQTGTNIWGGAFLVNDRGACAQVAFGFGHFYQCSVEIWGSQGRLFLDRAFTPKADQSPTIVVEKQGDRIEHRVPPDNHFIGSISEFQRAIEVGDQETHYQELLLQSHALDEIRRLANIDSIGSSL